MKSSRKFIHLRNYTQYSLSKGALKISDLVRKCVDEKIPAVGISDFNNLFGCMEFSLECKPLWRGPPIKIEYRSQEVLLKYRIRDP